jgi:hypothetical protein
MDLLKALKRTTIISTAALLALGATEAWAVSGTTTTGHVSASVQGNLAVTEVNAVRFGNFTISCTATACDGGSTIVMTDQGVRTATNDANDTITLLTATTANGNGGADLAGVSDATFGTGGQGPGIYDITTSDANQDSLPVYVTFATSDGKIIDATYNPTNNVQVIGPSGNAVANQTNHPYFTFDNITWDQVDQTGSGPNVYNFYNPTAPGSNEYGKSVLLNAAGHAEFQVGGTLHTGTSTSNYAPGKYVGTFYVMVSY